MVKAFLSHRAVDGNVAASTPNPALFALLFLYRDVLEVDLHWISTAIRAERPACLTVAPMQREATLVWDRLFSVRG